LKKSLVLLSTPMPSYEDNRQEDAESRQEDRLQQTPDITVEQRCQYPQRKEQRKRKQKCCGATEALEVFNNRRSHKRCWFMNSYILTSRQPISQ
jgi:hypothetical protein